MNPVNIVGIIIDMVSGLITGVGSALVEGFETLFIAPGGGLTTLATWAIIGIGIAFFTGVLGFVKSKV